MHSQLNIGPSRTTQRPAPSASLLTITAISFSLTFVGVSLAVLFGLLPPRLEALPLQIDIGVVLLIVPLCALVLAMMAEVVRIAVAGLPRPSPRRINALSEWRGDGREN